MGKGDLDQALMLGGGRPPAGLRARQMHVLNMHKRLTMLLDRARHNAIRKWDNEISQLKDKLKELATEKQLYRRRSMYLLEGNNEGFIAFHNALTQLQTAADTKHTFRRQHLPGEVRQLPSNSGECSGQSGHLPATAQLHEAVQGTERQARKESVEAKRIRNAKRRQSSPAVLHLNGVKMAMQPDSVIWDLLEGAPVDMGLGRRSSLAPKFPAIDENAKKEQRAKVSKLKSVYIVKELDDTPEAAATDEKSSPDESSEVEKKPRELRPHTAPQESNEDSEMQMKRFLVREKTSFMSPTLTADLKRNETVSIRRRLSIEPSTHSNQPSGYERLQLARRRRSKVIELPVNPEELQNSNLTSVEESSEISTAEKELS